MVVFSAISVFWILFGIIPSSFAGQDKRTYIDPHIHLMVHGITEISSKVDCSRFMDGRNYSIDTFERDSANTPVKYTVVMEAAMDSLAELDYIYQESCTHESIVGVIGGIPLTSDNFEELLDLYEARRGCGMLVGIRNWPQHGADFYNSRKLWPALAVLERRGLTLDLLLRPADLKNISVIARKFPHLKIIIDHQAYPTYNAAHEQMWYEGIASIARYPNVNMKVSGFLTTAEMDELFRVSNSKPSGPQPSRYDLYKDKTKHIIDQFGVDRCIYASNWPVDLLGADTYEDIYNMAASVTNYLSQQDRDKIFRDNAVRIYNVRMNHPPCQPGSIGGFSSGAPGPFGCGGQIIRSFIQILVVVANVLVWPALLSG